MNEKKNIETTKKAFEASFCEGKLYDRQTQDIQHLKRIIETLHIQKNDKVLDLGTGTGYVSFEIAREYKDVEIIGLDIVEETLKTNHRKAIEQGLRNINFVSYGGMEFPFDNYYFDVIVSRYALHHFPNIEYTFSEIARVLKRNGKFLVADPTPNENDTSRFVDEYMRMKPDGHIKYYTKDEFQKLGEKYGLSLTDIFQTEITFPRLKNTAYGYADIMQKHNKDIVSGYNIYETADGKYIYITQKVWNICFVKI